MDGKGLIYQQIPKVMQAVGAIGKGRTADVGRGGKYAFRGIDDLYNAVQPALIEHGVFVCPRVIDQKREERKTGSGGCLTYSILTVEHECYAADGSSVTVVTVGEAMDSGDKSSNKAMSAAMKYALIELLSIPTEGDNDTENNHPEPAPRQQKQPTAPPSVDLSAYPAFRQALMVAFTAREFTDEQVRAAVAAICANYRVDRAESIPLDKRAGVIAGIGKGLLDKFKRPMVAPVTSAKATADQITEVNELLTVVRVPDVTVKEWLGRAEVESFEEMSADILAKIITHLKSKLPGNLAAA